MAKEHKRLGDMLLEEQLITAADLQSAIVEQRSSGHLLGATLIRMGFISEIALLRMLERQLHLSLRQITVYSVGTPQFKHVGTVSSVKTRMRIRRSK